MGGYEVAPLHRTGGADQWGWHSECYRRGMLVVCSCVGCSFTNSPSDLVMHRYPATDGRVLIELRKELGGGMWKLGRDNEPTARRDALRKPVVDSRPRNTDKGGKVSRRPCILDQRVQYRSLFAHVWNTRR